MRPGDPSGRTYAEIIAQNLVEIACSEEPGAVNAANEISNRVEGRARQQIEIADFTADLRSRSDAELRFYLDNQRMEERMLSGGLRANGLPKMR